MAGRVRQAVAASLCVAVAMVATASATEPAPAVPVPASPSMEAGSPPAPPATSKWRLIVHPANSVRTLDRREIERIYRGRTKLWPDGKTLVPLNLPGSDALRVEFTREVLRSSVDELATFWNRQYFHGIAPPAVLQSTQAVCAYVAATEGAIGYVDACADAASVAVVEVDLGR